MKQGNKTLLYAVFECFVFYTDSYRGADKFLARPGRKQVNVSVRIA